MSIKIETWPIGNLIPYENNVKKHPPEQVKKIARLLRDDAGKPTWDQPIVVDQFGVIIKGHGRRLAAIENGFTKVPVHVRRDLTPEQVRLVRLADNRAAMSDTDSDLLRVELEELSFDDLEPFYDEKELNFMAADLGTMNTDAFVEDMDAVIEGQKENADAVTEKMSKARVPLAKAFGFKDLPVAGQIAITKLMAAAESATGLKADEALVAWAAELP